MSKYESLWQYWSLVSRWILMICENLTIVRLHQSIDYVFCCPCASLYFWSVETDCVQLCNSVLSYDTFSSTVMFFWCSLFASQHCWCSFLLNYFTLFFTEILILALTTWYALFCVVFVVVCHDFVFHVLNALTGGFNETFTCNATHCCEKKKKNNSPKN